MDDGSTPEPQSSERPPRAEPERVLRAKWRTSLDAGWTVIPSVLLRGLPRLHVGAGELAVLICLIDYWWAPDSPPWPSKKALSERLGVSTRTVQRSLSRLKAENLIKSEARQNASGGQTSNRYDLSPLVAKLEAIVADMKAAEEEAGRIRRAATRPGLRLKSATRGAAR